MTHTQYEEWLKLYFYDELDEQQKLLLENHLSECERCSMELEEIRKTHSILSQYKPVRIEEPILQEARRDLRLKIYSLNNKESLMDKLKEFFNGFLSPSLQIVAGGVAVLAIGILTGYLIFSSQFRTTPAFQQSSLSAIEPGEAQVVNVRFIERDPRTGNIEFTFETITPVHVRGNVDDEHIQKVLARALISEQNAGIRLRAVNMIGSRSEDSRVGVPALNEEVKNSLIKTMLNDKNLGVRKEALEVLKKYLPDPAIVRAFLNILANEKNTGLKISAINALDLSKYDNPQLNNEVIEMLKQKAQSDDNNYIRIKAKTALQEVQQ